VLLAAGMAFSGVLRAVGDAKRAMYVTLFGAVATAFTDPILIFGLGLGVNGAAYATVISRFIIMAVGFWGAVNKHDLVARPRAREAGEDVAPLFGIAGPAILTNLAAPVATSYMLAVFATFGEPIVAAFAIIDRVTPVAFGFLYALSGSVGPIMAQNYGARNMARVRRTLSDCFGLTIVYTLSVWVLLFFCAPWINTIFNAHGETADLVTFFCHFGAVAWLFLGLIFVANAAFNNLGFPIFSTLFNWGRATLGTIPFVTYGALQAGPQGGLVGMIAGAALFGVLAVTTAYWAVRRMAKRVEAAALTESSLGQP
jgi:Na+-driven multidrug efflux pump